MHIRPVNRYWEWTIIPTRHLIRTSRFRLAAYVSSSFDGNYLNQYLHPKQKYLKTIIKLPDWRKTTYNCRVLGSVWVLFHLSTHTTPIYPTHFAGSPYTARITVTITPNLILTHLKVAVIWAIFFLLILGSIWVMLWVNCRRTLA